jgi:hypothetical protein
MAALDPFWRRSRICKDPRRRDKWVAKGSQNWGDGYESNLTCVAARPKQIGESAENALPLAECLSGDHARRDSLCRSSELSNRPINFDVSFVSVSILGRDGLFREPRAYCRSVGSPGYLFGAFTFGLLCVHACFGRRLMGALSRDRPAWQPKFSLKPAFCMTDNVAAASLCARRVC